MADKNGQTGGAYANPKIDVTPIMLTNGSSSGANLNKENNSAINDAMAQATSPQSGFNRNLKKRIKGADNIAQQTRLKIKLDKREQNQERRAQKKLDRNPEYVQRASDKAEGRVDASLNKLDAAMNPFKPTNGYKANGVKKSMPTGNLMSEGGGVFGLSKSVANGSTAPKSSPNSKVNNRKAATMSVDNNSTPTKNNKTKEVKAAIKEAKKEIRKGGSVSGGSNVVDRFGSVHGYQSDATNELKNSRLVQRKNIQDHKKDYKYVKSTYGSKKDFEGTPKFGEWGDESEMFTRKESKQTINKIHKKLKNEMRSDIKKTRTRAKEYRKSHRK